MTAVAPAPAEHLRDAILRQSLDDVLGRCRCTPTSWLRQAVMLRLWREGLSMEAVGRLLGRDHSTVSYGIARAMRGL